MRIFRRLTALTMLLLLSGMMYASAYAAGYTTLEMGDTGSEVTSMQTALITLGYLSGSADGNFGPATLEAVKGFQKGNNLKSDGKAGNQTLSALFQLAGAGTPAQTDVNTASGKLVLGDSGSAVKSMQAALVALGYSTGSADGKFGNATLQAVKAFQKANQLTVDGKAGTATLNKLYALAQGSGGTTDGSSAVCTSTTLSHTLRLGHAGSDVSQVQTKLVELGYLQSVSGTYDSTTVSAVKAFQARNNQKADGLAGTKTFQVMFSSGAISAEGAQGSSGGSGTAYATLRQGASGDAVTALQSRLAALEYAAESTGTYDSKTAAAVKSFQSRNKLQADGVAGVKTQTILYSDNAVKYSPQTAVYDAPSIGKIKLLHWDKDVKPALRGKSSIYVYDPASGYSYTLHLYSLGRHADVEPMTADDTASMMAAFGGKATWTPKFVYVRLPNGEWTAATMHNVAHGGQSIKDNNFDGQNCVHFLRDMEETMKNDPDYGVTNQNALRKGWKQLTGEVVN